MDTLPTATLELAHWAARFLGLCPPAAALHRLIGLVFAVWVTVTTPECRDALRVIAAELVLAAGGGRAFLLIAGIPTVVVSITNKDRCHTPPISALEVFGGAGLGIYRKIGTSKVIIYNPTDIYSALK